MAEAAAMAKTGWKPREFFASGKAAELGVPIAVLAIVMALITPLPPFLLDLLLVVDIMMSVIVMMVAMYITRPSEFNVFPTTLLLLTLFRLALNVSSARLILLNGNTGTSAAGHVIEAFGSFVVGGNYIIGAVIFLVLIAIQYVVINHGAVRISEVTARFTLDALPGKQMSIDSDLSSGLIDESEARRRRKQLAAEAEFYGAMDGASRFTQRDAVASILITGINIIAGFLIGVLQHGMELRHALETYTVLTIGDGLVTVVPALMISVSGGLIITRSGSEARLGADFRKQIFGSPQPLLLASGVLLVLACVPGHARHPVPAAGRWGWGPEAGACARGRLPRGRRPAAAKPARENLEGLLKVEPLAIEVGLGLVKMVEGGAELAAAEAHLRHPAATGRGSRLPFAAGAGGRQSGAARAGIRDLAQGRGDRPLRTAAGLPVGHPRRHGTRRRSKARPRASRPSDWRPGGFPDQRAEQARAAGYTLVDAVSVLGTHIAELARRHAHELFSRQDAKKVLDLVAVEQPKVVEDLVPKQLPLSAVQRVLQNLLRERVSIRDTGSILEALGEAALSTRNLVLLTEYARQAIRRTVVKRYLDAAGNLPAYFLDASIEQAVESAVQHGEQNSHLSMAPQTIREILERIQRKVGSPEGAGGGGHHRRRPLFPAANGRSRPCRTCSSFRTTRSRPA